MQRLQYESWGRSSNACIREGRPHSARGLRIVVLAKRKGEAEGVSSTIEGTRLSQNQAQAAEENTTAPLEEQEVFSQSADVQEASRSIEPPSPPRGPPPQRTVYVAGTAVMLALAAAALWSAQHWRLPWDRPRKKQPPREEISQHATKIILPDPADLAAAVDDQPLRSKEEEDRLEVQRLKAARVALERRLSQLDASSDRRVGILAPFIPENERPWRDRIQSQRLEDESIAEVLRTDKTADMSMQWDLEANEETLNELKQELDDIPEEALTAEKEEIKSALEQMDRELRPPPGREFEPYENMDQAGLPPEVEKPSVPEEQPAEPSEDLEKGLSKDIPGVSEGLLPGLSKVAEDEREGAVLPKQSDINIKEEPATNQEIENLQGSVIEVRLPGQTPIRRSQKPVPKIPGQLRLVAGGACIPAPAKAAAGKGGEDAFFVSEALWGAIGVADGVGGCSEDGVDASLFSRSMLETAAAATEHGWGRSKNQGARGLLHIGQIGAMNIAGTSTVCIGLMMLGPTLQIANLGDSGFRIFRNERCLFASQIQQHSFNCPYQAGSPKLHPHSNNANDAEVYELDLKPHDVVIMATDGVLDNLWDEDLQDIISAFNQAYAGPEDENKAEALALTIVKAASARGMNANANTPWILEAAKHRPQLLPLHKRFWPRGGKPDDCTAVVAYMHEDDRQY